MDLRYALRLLWKDRAFTATTVSTLAVCLAANTAIFAIVNAVLLRPLPFPEAERLVAIYNRYPGAGVERASNSVPDYYDRRTQADAFEEVAMYRSAGMTIGGQRRGEAERVTGMQATPSLFRLLRAEPLRGRLFVEAEAEPGQDRKAVLSEALWQRAFGGRDDVVGAEVRIGGVPHTVVGVLPRTFRFLDPDVQVWTVVAFTAGQRADDERHSNNWQQIGRLEADASVALAQSQIDAINARNMDRLPQWREILTNARFSTRVRDFQTELVEESRPTLFLLWGGVAFVLVIGCVNIANLVAVRATARVRELATRAALGASTARLSRQLLTETMVLSTVGGALGVGLGWWALRAAPVLGLDRLPRGHEIALDGGALLFTGGMVLGVGLLVGLMPVVALRRTNLAQVVREEGRTGTATRGARIARRALVTSQVAFALVLLFGAGLLLASFERILAIRPGFDARGVITGRVSFPASRYGGDREVDDAVDRLLARARALPGVDAAGVTSSLPLADDYSDSVILAEGYQMRPGESLVSPNTVSVSPGYFEAMGTALVRGRFFDARDAAGAPLAIIVDERLARRFWGDKDPVGRRMYRPTSAENLMAPPPADEWLTVVGVIETVRLTSLVEGGRNARVGAYYLPFAQVPDRSIAIAVRTPGFPESLVGPIRAELAAIDPELPLYSVLTMADRVDLALVDRRTPMVLAVGFAAAALVLSAIGIYGMLAYQVSQRRREIGIRMALGAEAGRIFGMIAREGAAIVSAGVLLGAAGAYLLRGALASQIYEVGALDPRVIGGAGAVLLAVAAVACLLPARRAARTDPVVALNE